jgi:hypothetical protein
LSSLTDRWDATSDAIASGVFDPVGSNYTTFLPSALSPGGGGLNPSVSGKAASSVGTASTSPFDFKAGLNGGEFNYLTDAGKASGATPNVNEAVSGAIGAAGASSGSASSSGAAIKEILLRVTVIVLGFIFVATGLAMFKGPAIIPGLPKLPR